MSNEFLCANGHRWSSGSGSPSKVCPWCEIERLEGILHRVANHMRDVDDAVEVSRKAARTANDMMVVGPFVELIDWYTFDEEE